MTNLKYTIEDVLTRTELRYKIVARLTKLPAATPCSDKFPNRWNEDLKSLRSETMSRQKEQQTYVSIDIIYTMSESSFFPPPPKGPQERV